MTSRFVFGGVKKRSRLDLNIQEGECNEENGGPRLGCSNICRRGKEKEQKTARNNSQ